MWTVAGSPTEAYVDAVKAALVADATLIALVIGIYGYVPGAARTAFPYIRLSQQQHFAGEHGGMQLPGGRVSLQIDVFSDGKGPHETRTILSRMYAVLERRTLSLGPFVMVTGSLHCTQETIFDEPDADAPERRLYHGVHVWDAFVEAAI